MKKTWYLVNENGVLATSRRKRDIVNHYGIGIFKEKGVYQVYDRDINTPKLIGWLFHEKENVINHGWGWIFNI